MTSFVTDEEVHVIIVAGSIDVDPAERDAFLASRVEVMRRSRAEDGCLQYCFGADPIDAGRVILLERWASNEALDAHVAALARDPAPLPGEARPLASSIAAYEVASERSLGG